MHTKEENQLQTLLDNRDAIFVEYNANKSNMTFETMHTDRKSYILSDKKNIFTSNDSLMPTVSNLLDSTLNIMSISFSEFGSVTHQGWYQISWDVNYPVKRYYIANTGDDKAAVGSIDDDNILSLNVMTFADWKTSGDFTGFNEDPSSTNNIYMSIDIWDPTQTPTDTQITNYYKFFETFPGVQQLSSELQSFIDAN